MHSCSGVEVRDVEHDLESAIVDNVQLSLQRSLKLSVAQHMREKDIFGKKNLKSRFCFIANQVLNMLLGVIFFFLPAFSLIHGFLDSVCCIISMSLSLTWLRQ